MTDAVKELILVNKYFIYFFLTGFLVESTWDIYLLTRGFCLEKKGNEAFAYKLIISFFYFLFLNIAMVIDLFVRKIPYENFSYLFWFASVSLLSFGLYKFVDKFQVTKQRRSKKRKRRRQKQPKRSK